MFLEGFIHDITEFKKAEDDLKKSQSMIERAQKAAHFGCWNSDLQTGELIWSSEVFHIFGIDPETFDGKREKFHQLVHPDDRGTMFEAVEAAIRSHSPYSIEHRIILPDGTMRWVSERADVILNEEGLPIQLAGVILDITASKKMEEEKKKLEQQLQQSQKMEAIGQLAGGVAHDFNNLLTVIQGYSDLALMSLDKDNPHRGEIEEIQEAATRAETITRQLLAFSRKQVIQPVVLNLNTTVADMGKMLQRLIGEDIELITNYSDDLKNVKADRGQMEQVVVNLAVNARDAMPDGGTLTIETANVELDETYTNQRVDVNPGLYVMLAVSDSGTGMEPEVLSHIFEPFFTTKEKDKGTGLGLATVYGIVKQNNGHIGVYSEPGYGATFKIYLPQTEESIPSSKSDSLNTSHLHGTETVLVLEDDKNVRVLTETTLTQFGYHVFTAADSDEAFALFDRHAESIDILITDVIMPKMSGPTVVKHLNATIPNLKVLYISGYTDNTIFNQGVIEPGSLFLQKPFQPIALVKKVREALDAK